jgi:hypothetical protein
VNRLLPRDKIQAVPRKDFYFAGVFATLTLAIHVLGLLRRQVHYLYSGLEILASQTIFWLLSLMGLALLVAVIALWYRKLAGLIASLVSLLIVGAGYFTWYWISRHDLALQSSNPFYGEHPEAMTQHLFGFVEARWWDVIICTMVAVLFLWELKTLLLILPSSRQLGTPQK